MEWLVLLALVPVIVAPVVLLYGFAGCKFDPQDGTLSPPADPTNVRVESKDIDRITLKWDYLDAPPLPVTFEVEINDLNTEPPSQTFARDIPQTTREFPHTGLQEGKVFEYRVRAVQGFETRESNFVPNPPLRAATLSFQTAFQATLTSNDGGNDGACTVQRIEPASLLVGGTLPGNNRVRITLLGPTAGGLTLDRVTISRAAVPGDDPNNPNPDLYDSGPDRTQLAAAVVVPTSDIHVVPPVVYQLNKNVPLLIAFDINNTADRGRCALSATSRPAWRPCIPDRTPPRQGPTTARPGTAPRPGSTSSRKLKLSRRRPCHEHKMSASSVWRIVTACERGTGLCGPQTTVSINSDAIVDCISLVCRERRASA